MESNRIRRLTLRRGFLAFIIITSVAIQTSVADRHWSPKAVSLPQFWDSNSHAIAVPSPNNKLILRVRGKRTGKTYPEDEWVPDYFLEEHGHRLNPAIHPYATPEALWSPDSDVLAITSSDGGLVGNWKVYTYTVNGGEGVRHDVMKQVQADLAAAFPAGVNLDLPRGLPFSKQEQKKFAKVPSWVNVVAIHWLKSPERLLVSASVPPSSGYGKNMGQRRGYIIDPITGSILQSYDDAELKHLWGKYLGD